MILASRRRTVWPAIAAPLLAAPFLGGPAAAGVRPAPILLADEPAKAPPTAVKPPVAPAPVTKPMPAEPKTPPPPKNLEPLAPDKFTGILGKKVMAPDGTELGLVVDVVVDEDGHPHAAVIDFGGFLGVGSRKIAVDWRLLSFAPGKPDWHLQLSLGRGEIQAAPIYKPDSAKNKMVGPPWNLPPTKTEK